MTRPKGFATKPADVRRAIIRLDRAGKISLQKIVIRLAEIAESNDKDRIRAAQVLFGYAFGLPRSDVKIEHEIGASAEKILIELAKSDTYRHALTRAAEVRLLSTAATVVPERQEPS